MAKHLPPHLKGKEPTPAHTAANAALLEAFATPKTEEAAFTLFHAWLAPNMPESNRWQFGKLVRRWMLRRGQSLISERGIHKTLRPSLYDALAETFPDSPNPNTILFGLGVSSQITQKFWEKPERLTNTLNFIDVPALWALKELNIAKDLEITAPIPPNVLALLDGFWMFGEQPKRKQWAPNKEKTKHFGDWVRTTFLTDRGDQSSLAHALTSVTFWDISQKIGSGSSSAEISLYVLLSGKSGSWSYPMLEVLAQFAYEKTGKEWTPERLANAYANHRADEASAA